LVKLCQVAERMNLKMDLICWSRNGGNLNTLPTPINKHEVIFTGGGYGGKYLKWLYPIWMMRLMLKLLFSNIDSPLYCLGFECAFPAYLISKLKKIDYIFDDADRFSMIFSLPRPLGKILKKMESLVSKNAVVHIIPGMARYEFKHESMRVLRNTPDSTALSRSKSTSTALRSEKYTVYVNGWMGETRGLPTMVEVANLCLQNSTDIRFLAAGRVDGTYGQEFIQLGNVDYLGEISNVEALANYRIADIVVTYYDPAIEINQFAEPNKWGDAIRLGVPVVVNAEVRTSDYLNAAGACIQFRYDDAEGFFEFLDNHLNRDRKTATMRENILKLNNHLIDFDDALESILQGI